MLSTSSTWKSLVANDEAHFRTKLVITFLSGGTVTVLSDRIYQGMTISKASSDQSSFSIGSAVISSLNVSILNEDEAFNSYNFTGAKIEAYIGVVTDTETVTEQKTITQYDDSGNTYPYTYNEDRIEETIEYIKVGTFTVSSSKKQNQIVILDCLGNLSKMDRSIDDYDETQFIELSYPATLYEIAKDCCRKCGLTFNNLAFDGSDITIEKPTDMSMTYREYISYVAQMAGYFVAEDVDGNIEFRWYQNTQVPYTDENNNTTNGLYDIKITDNKTVDFQDITITGIRTTYTYTNTDGENVQVAATYPETGFEGYVISFDNPLINENNVFDILDLIGPKIVGITMRPMDFDGVPDISVEPGDIVKVSGNSDTYTTYITNIKYTTGNNEHFYCDAETKEENNAVLYTQSVKNQNTTKQLVEGMQGDIKSKDIAIYKQSNNSDVIVQNGIRKEVLSLKFASEIDCIAPVYFTSNVDMDRDGYIIFQLNINNNLQTLQYKQNLLKGKSIITIFQPLEIKKSTRYKISMTALVGYDDDSQIRIDEAKTKTIENFISAYNQAPGTAVTYNIETIDTTNPIATIPAENAKLLIFGQGVASNTVWDGVLKINEYAGYTDIPFDVFKVGLPKSDGIASSSTIAVYVLDSGNATYDTVYVSATDSFKMITNIIAEGTAETIDNGIMKSISLNYENITDIFLN